MATSSNLIRVFVYGTLKSGQPNHFLMQDVKNGMAKFIARAVTTEKFPLVVATRYNIPFLLNKPGTGNYINGEIYEVDQQMFEVLDKLEDYPTWYDREILEMSTTDQKISCWIYMLKNYPEKLLKLPMLTSYESSVDKPYLESYYDYCSMETMNEDLKNF
ncbi:unnamed protein product [Chironomus riparius]|uniref:Gamma-glutamylcyclotransferase family protein n=1 Tax=Chironomus riparius TaxID=315576 RepID=A0A9P0JB02_9DIPT|nr:unnamed protein product [Chironomus riparius]